MIGRVERAEPVDQALRDRPFGLVGDQPARAFVVHAGHAEAVGQRAAAVAHSGVDLGEVLPRLPRPVVVPEFERAEQLPVFCKMIGATSEQRLIAIGPDRHRRLRRDLVGDRYVRRRNRPEITDAGVIWPLGIGDPVDDLRDEEAEIGIALSVGVGRAIDRHVVDEVGEVGAVIEVVATDKILVGLAFPRMHRDDEAGDTFEELAGSQDRAELDLLRRDCPLARGRGAAQQIGARCRDDDVGRRRRRCWRFGHCVRRPIRRDRQRWGRENSRKRDPHSPR